jgi:hypothetical protein
LVPSYAGALVYGDELPLPEGRRFDVRVATAGDAQAF